MRGLSVEAGVVTQLGEDGFEVGGPRARQRISQMPPLLGLGGMLAVLRSLIAAERPRWFYWLPVFFGAGIVVYFHLSQEPPLWLACVPLAGALGLRFAIGPAGTGRVVAAGICLAMASGFLAAKVRTEWVRAPVLNSQTGAVEIRGFVELIERKDNGSARVTLWVSSLGQLADHKRPVRVRFTVRKGVSGFQPGDGIKTRVRLSPPPGPVSPGGFDFARHAWFQRLGGVGYALRPLERDASLRQAPIFVRAAARIGQVRKMIGERVRTHLDGQVGAIAVALISGQRGGISDATNEAFRDSGLFHILSISGLHMAIMGGAVFFALRFFLALFPYFAERYPIKKWAAVGAVFGAFGYLLISGGTAPTVRSFLMISVMFLAVLLDRPALALRNVAVAALLILLVTPEAIINVGFQMSFAAVVALVAAYEGGRGIERRWVDRGRGVPAVLLIFFIGIVVTTLLASGAVAPFAAYHFHKSQQLAVIANLIAVPVCNLIVMPAALGALVLMPLGLEGIALIAMGSGIEAMLTCAHWVAGLPGASARVPAISDASFALMVVGGLWLCLMGQRWRWAGLAVMAGGVLAAPFRQMPDVLVGRDGGLVAVRGSDGRLSALKARRVEYDLSRWLDKDGDGRPPEAVMRGRAFLCRADRCTATVKGLDVVVWLRARGPSRSTQRVPLDEDCARADILILRGKRPSLCEGPRVIIDGRAVRRHGAHAVYIEAPNGGENARRGSDGRLLRHHRIRRETVAQLRGARPWAIRTVKRWRRRKKPRRFQ